MAIVARLQKWRINAPDGYRWTNEEVLGEKTQSFCNGLIVGALIFPWALLLGMRIGG